jgi:hypothetical protein
MCYIFYVRDMLKTVAIAGALLFATGVDGERKGAAAAPMSSPPSPSEATRAKLEAKREVVCDKLGCRLVKKGCRIEYRTGIAGGPVPTGGNVEICK